LEKGHQGKKEGYKERETKASDLVNYSARAVKIIMMMTSAEMG